MRRAAENKERPSSKLEFARVSQSHSRKTKAKTPSPITLRLTAQERELLKKLSHGTSMSAYIRKCALGDQVSRRKRRSYTVVADRQALARVLGMLGETHIANNLNQLAHHANTGSLLLDEQSVSQIEEAHDAICAMRKQLVAAIGLVEEREQ